MNASDRSLPPAPARIRVAQALALVALVSALIGALGPADRVRTTYSWPPETLPTGTPERLWYTPLLLVRQQPELLTADVPCRLPRTLPGGEPGAVLATARHPERVGGLAITQSRRELVVRVGETVVDRVELPPGGGVDDCAHRVSMAGGRWSVSGGNGIQREGALEAMPVVTGLFSALDLASGTSPSVDVTTHVHATPTTTRQAVAWALAAMAGTVALLLVAFDARPRRLWARGRRPLAGAAANTRLPDAVVAVVLLGWWVLSPAYLDDGWVIARELMFSSSRGFSNYYSNVGANLPLNYWHEWLEHWLVEASSSLLFLRTQALLYLALTWICCRWVLARVLASSVGESRTALWSLATVFVVGAMSWGMT
ncbi:MAG: arabinosyltransferase domain-containing protein, partial [Gaiellaceae bacterium]